MITYQEDDNIIFIETLLIRASVRTVGYVSGIMGGSFLDKKTGVHDLGLGLHIMDFLLAPGWREDGYSKNRMLHGDLPKHYVEGPQICTKAGYLNYNIIQGKHYLAIKQWFIFTKPGVGYRAGSRWEQTLLFLPDKRYFFSSETIVSANDVNTLFYRIDMPGHIKHNKGDTFSQIYLSYYGLIESKEFLIDFPPDERFFYRRKESVFPHRFIRAYQLHSSKNSTVWLAGMTLDPTIPYEAWCHQRDYVCLIQENHGRPVKKGETIGAAYIIGYFDSIDEINHVYDCYKGTKYIEVDSKHFELLDKIPQGIFTY